MAVIQLQSRSVLLIILVALVAPPGCSRGTSASPPPATEAVPVPSTSPATDTSAPPPDVSLPPLSGAEAVNVKTWLLGPGALLLRFRALAAPLHQLDPADPSSVAECTSVAASLDAVNPNDLYDLADQVPDASLRELFLDERRLVSDMLVACGRGDAPAMAKAKTPYLSADLILGRRLSEIGL